MTYIPNNQQREYGIEDLEMLEKAQVIHNMFIQDKSTFISYFTIFEDPYAANFQTAINIADAMPQDSELISEIGVYTERINEVMESCRVALQELFMYAKQCFLDSSARMKKFGQGEDYTKAYQSYLRMNDLMNKAHRTANSSEYKTELINKGYTQLKIDNLKNIANELDSLIANYEDAKSDRLIATEDRIKNFNILWNYLKTISESSKVIYRDSPAKLHQYTLYPKVSKVPYKVQNVRYNENDRLLTWDKAENANLYVIEARMDAPIKEKDFSQRAETNNDITEWRIYLPEGVYSLRVKGKHNGISGSYSQVVENVILT